MDGDNLAWPCPSCGARQEETERCWSCEAPKTACGTCRHLRRAVVGRISFCGIDKRRGIVDVCDVRACWTAPVELQRAASHGRRIGGGDGRLPRLSWASGGLWEGLEA